MEQSSRKAQPPVVVAALPSTTKTGAQMRAVIAQQFRGLRLPTPLERQSPPMRGPGQQLPRQGADIIGRRR
uniref:Uncharacterized protein n=1 Tax=Romanomermis culicivorax TaxID=13658 RepID=A0A915J333_ROMCU